MNLRIYILSLTVIFTACSNVEDRIELLENKLQIEMPNEYTIVQDEDISYNGLESDYKVVLKLQLESEGIQKIENQINQTPYYNQLVKFQGKGNGIGTFTREEMVEFKLIQDSILKTKYRGTWIETVEGFEFIDFGDKMEPIDACIDSKENTLTFEFNKL